jgi:hypothetical protein
MSSVSSVRASAETALDFLCLVASHLLEAVKEDESRAGDKRRRDENSVETRVSKVGSEGLKNKRPFRLLAQSKAADLSPKASMGSRSGTFLNLPELVASSSKKIDVEASMAQVSPLASKIIKEEKPKRKVSPLVPREFVHLFQSAPKVVNPLISMPIVHPKEALRFFDAFHPEDVLKGFQMSKAERLRREEKKG